MEFIFLVHIVDDKCTESIGLTVYVFSRSVMSDSLRPQELWPARLLVHGISQARVLEWVAIFFSRGSSRPRH